MVNFDVTKEEAKLIQAIALRADNEVFNGWTTQSIMDTEMDITATHANGCQLKLKELLMAKPFDFAHDVGGIRKFLDRNTGQLLGYFLPRFAQKQES